MAYRENDLTDILNRKEFAQFKVNNDSHTNTIESNAIVKNNLNLTGYQLFNSNYINPNTPYKRLLLKWKTGVGKTLGCLAIANNFVKQFQKENTIDKSRVKKVYILGFNEFIFRNELLRYSEFGFISDLEIKELARLKRATISGNVQDITNYDEFMSKVKRRIVSGKYNGLYEFIGYRSFVNDMFGVSNDINITDTDESTLINMIEENKIKINDNFIDQFKDCLVICDEIHNVYNSVEKNSWGISLQILARKVPSCRFVYTSATPINNSPTEIVDLLNLLDTSGTIHTKDDFFIKGSLEFKPDAENNLTQLLKGKVSYIVDKDINAYPTFKFVGDTIDNVDYLKFIRCAMSEFQFNTYLTIPNLPYINQDDLYVLDFALENPNQDSKVGIFNSSQIKSALKLADKSYTSKYFSLNNDKIVGPALNINTIQKYSNKYFTMLNHLYDNIKIGGGKVLIYHSIVHMSGVLFIEQLLLNNGFIGEFDTPTNNTICSICGLKKSEHVSSNKKGGSTSLSISHNANSPAIINNSYVFLQSDFNDISNVDEIFNHLNMYKNKDRYIYLTDEHVIKVLSCNGYKVLFLDEDLSLLYKKCQPENLEQKIVVEPQGGGHLFKPARFIVLHGGIDKRKFNHSIDKFNADSNKNGENILVAIGSRTVKEGIDFKCIRNEYIMSRPDNISMLLQIKGRAVRKNSHAALPEDQRHVNIKIFTSCLPDRSMSSEELKYVEKIDNYKKIQIIERIIHENAIDGDIFESYKYIDNVDSKMLEDLPYTPKVVLSQNINTSTFDAFYKEQELDVIRTIIKRLFIEVSPIYKKSELVPYIKASNYAKINLNNVSDSTYNLAISSLLYNENSEEKIVIPEHGKSLNNLILNTDSNILYFSETDKRVIVELKNYYITCRFDTVESTDGIDRIILDSEDIFRDKLDSTNVNINVNEFVKFTTEINFNYDNKRDTLFNKYKHTDLSEMQDVLCTFNLHFHTTFLEEVISYVFNYINDTKFVQSTTMHDFYLKMLFYYDIMNLVIFAGNTQSGIAKKYTNYFRSTTKKDIDNYYKIKGLKDYFDKDKTQLDDENIGTVLSLNNKYNVSLSNRWIPSEFRALKDNFTSILEQSRRLKQKVPSIYLPIGHYLSESPKLYVDNAWEYYYAPKVDFIENDIIVGFEDRTEHSIYVKFKLRSPVQNIIKHTDVRLIEKGVVCSSKSKSELINISERLGITLDERINIIDLCAKIKTKLIRLELLERIKKSKVKYFYFHYEKQPI